MKIFKHIFYPIQIIIMIFFLSGCSDKNPGETQTPNDQPQPVMKYGLDITGLIQVDDFVKRNQTLSEILQSFKVPFTKIVDLANASKDIFDVKDIQFGKKYSVFLEPDSTENVEYFVYELDPINYISFNLRDSLMVKEGSRPVKTVERRLSGVIESSLYETLEQLDASPLLAIKLADLFAWQIDFYTVRKGDNFKVIFYEKFVDGEFIGVGQILAACFENQGKAYYGFYYEIDGKPDYFDEKGNSLHKAFLKAPVKFTRISSRYSRSRLHPILRIYRPHLGIDYAAPTGTPVQAVGDGVVTDKRWTNGGGRYVKIRHNSAYQSGYMHLSKYGKGIYPGAKVRQGQIIGYVGSTGLATGPHLDFRFWKHGKLVNYLKIEFPPSHPVDQKHKSDFEYLMSNFKRALDATSLPDKKPV